MSWLNWLFNRKESSTGIPRITSSGGRAACIICDKRIRIIYEVEGYKYYFCKKHARNFAEGKVCIPKPQAKDKVWGNRTEPCEKCGKKVKDRHVCHTCYQRFCLECSKSHKCQYIKSVKGSRRLRPDCSGSCEMCGINIDEIYRGFYCKYCKKWHCGKHRLPEDHYCSGSPRNNLPQAGRIIYHGNKSEYVND